MSTLAQLIAGMVAGTVARDMTLPDNITHLEYNEAARTLRAWVYNRRISDLEASTFERLARMGKVTLGKRERLANDDDLNTKFIVQWPVLTGVAAEPEPMATQETLL
jgi:hypothetical protein